MQAGNNPEKPAFTITGYNGCSFFSKAKKVASKLPCDARIVSLSRDDFQQYLKEHVRSRDNPHATSPAIFLGDEETGQFIGGFDDFFQFCSKEYPEEFKKREGACIIS